MTGLVTLVFGSVVGVVIVVILKRPFSKANGIPPLPPGPKGLPLAGNLNDLPKTGVLEAHHWLKHKDLYGMSRINSCSHQGPSRKLTCAGPISSVTVMGQTLVIINDAQLAFELLEKRSVKHSSRPRQIFAGEMYGLTSSLIMFCAGLTALGTGWAGRTHWVFPNTMAVSGPTERI